MQVALMREVWGRLDTAVRGTLSLRLAVSGQLKVDGFPARPSRT